MELTQFCVIAYIMHRFLTFLSKLNYSISIVSSFFAGFTTTFNKLNINGFKTFQKILAVSITKITKLTQFCTIRNKTPSFSSKRVQLINSFFTNFTTTSNKLSIIDTTLFQTIA